MKTGTQVNTDNATAFCAMPSFLLVFNKGIYMISPVLMERSKLHNDLTFKYPDILLSNLMNLMMDR